ncbi:MAG: phosphate ABC transporter permease PstA [Calditrichales bacterium]|nr:MAG: phosphate ABC transporter permease PstA [Calditrichales bacterium]
MKARSTVGRKFFNLFIKVMAYTGASIGLFFLLWILYVVMIQGVSAINWSFFTEMPSPPGMEGGGLANAIMGTLLITLIATLIGVPIGLLAGVFLSEIAQSTRYAAWIRFLANALMGTPSIIIGVFVYAAIVIPMGQFSGYAGAIALAIIMLPVIARTTEDILQMVPNALRESALALGTTRWRTTLFVVFKSARTGLMTGVLLAVARVSGETAPLLFTALNSQYWPDSLSDATANLTVTIYNYAMSPYSDWQAMAWGASFLITLAVLITNISTRIIFREKRG